MNQKYCDKCRCKKKVREYSFAATSKYPQFSRLWCIECLLKWQQKNKDLEKLPWWKKMFIGRPR